MIVCVGPRRSGKTTWLLTTAIENAIKYSGSVGIIMSASWAMENALSRQIAQIFHQKFKEHTFHRCNKQELVFDNSSRLLFCTSSKNLELYTRTNFGKSKCFAYFDEFTFFPGDRIMDCTYITDAYFCSVNIHLYKNCKYKCRFKGISFIDKEFLACLWIGMHNYATKKTFKVKLNDCQNDNMCRKCAEKCCIKYGRVRVVSELCPFYTEMYLIQLRQNENKGNNRGRATSEMVH